MDYFQLTLSEVGHATAHWQILDRMPLDPPFAIQPTAFLFPNYMLNRIGLAHSLFYYPHPKTFDTDI